MTKPFCKLPFDKIKITPSGNVNMCCYQGCWLGNILKDSLEDIWNSAMSKQIRDDTYNGTLHPCCRKWGGCPYIHGERPEVEVVPNRLQPVEIEFDLPSTHCNVGGTNPTPETACFMCPRAAKNFQAEPDLTFQIVEKIKPLIPGLEKLMVLGIAEPFWKDLVFEVLERLEFPKYKETIFFDTFTNATVFNEKKQDRFLNTIHKSRLVFSIDAATPETYQKIRRLDAFDLVKKNIISYGKKRDPERHFTQISNNINTLNVLECVKMVEVAAELGVDRIVLNPTHNCGGLVQIDEFLVNEKNACAFKAAEDKAKRRAEELGVNLSFFRPLALDYPKKRIPLL
jgi:MoaA/NifB/PqqE/SkfB family radical SAM enzyme